MLMDAVVCLFTGPVLLSATELKQKITDWVKEKRKKWSQ